MWLPSSPFAEFALIFVSTAPATAIGPYRLPWAPEIDMALTQDCNDSAYADHVGSHKNAWDFANGTHFPVRAARGGIVTHLKMSSDSGCATEECVDLANYIVIDHGDGTASVYLHFDGHSRNSSVRCGARVRQGQLLGTAGATGWATGPHLHFQVDAVHTDDDALCECGSDGLACAKDEAAWSSFWSSATFPSMPVRFEEWPANECSDRRIVMPISLNVGTGGQSPTAVGRGGSARLFAF